MRSRAPIGKWWPHLAQTLRFSSSSLSKSIVAHFGHLVHKPSGMSRFLDLVEPSFGFLAKAAPALAGGGVTAGSTVSRPRDFLMKLVVAIISRGLADRGTCTQIMSVLRLRAVYRSEF